MRSVPSFARATAASVAVNQEKPPSSKKKRKKVGLDLSVNDDDPEVSVAQNPMEGIPHFGGRDQGKIRTLDEIVKITKCQGLDNIICEI